PHLVAGGEVPRIAREAGGHEITAVLPAEREAPLRARTEPRGLEHCREAAGLLERLVIRRAIERLDAVEPGRTEIARLFGHVRAHAVVPREHGVERLAHD